MKLAAAAVAEAASVMLEARPGAVLILAGSGGNGGDGLYAGAALASRGATVHALVPERCHEEALAAFRSAGGTVLSPGEVPTDTALLIDAIAGLGSARGLSDASLSLYRDTTAAGAAVLAVDMPTGVDADTGVCAADADADPYLTWLASRLRAVARSRFSCPARLLSLRPSLSWMNLPHSSSPHSDGLCVAIGRTRSAGRARFPPLAGWLHGPHHRSHTRRALR